ATERIQIRRSLGIAEVPLLLTLEASVALKLDRVIARAHAEVDGHVLVDEIPETRLGGLRDPEDVAGGEHNVGVLAFLQAVQIELDLNVLAIRHAANQRGFARADVFLRAA